MAAVRYWALQDRDDLEPYGVLAVVDGDLLPRIFVPGSGLVDIPSAADWAYNGEPGAHRIGEEEALSLMARGVCAMSREGVQQLRGDAPDIWPEGLDRLPPRSTDPSQDVAEPEGQRPPGGVTASHQAKHYVGGPQGRPPTGEEALEMGRALFDAINGERHAAQNDDGGGQPGDEPGGRHK